MGWWKSARNIFVAQYLRNLNVIKFEKNMYSSENLWGLIFVLRWYFKNSYKCMFFNCLWENSENFDYLSHAVDMAPLPICHTQLSNRRHLEMSHVCWFYSLPYLLPIHTSIQKITFHKNSCKNVTISLIVKMKYALKLQLQTL
jgi:hypothetical protein